MPQAGFGQGNDYGSLFASLWAQDEANRERLARDLERRNDERQAAKDSEMFSKFEHGDIDGDAILAYIRHRVEQTSYDPEQQAKWKDALRDYTDSISDQKAEDAFANGGSIQALIQYYTNRRKGVEPGSPIYSQLTQRMNQLIDQSASDDAILGSERIEAKIAKGQASYDDLARFWQRQLQGLRPNSPYRAQFLQNMDNARQAAASQEVQSKIAQIDYQFQAGQIDGVEANRRLTSVAAQFRVSDPVQYWNLLNRGQSYINAQQQDQDLIPNPGALSGYGYNGSTSPSGNGPGGNGPRGTIGTGNGAFNYVYQLDGSPFARLNCVFASGAMLAQAMGVENLSGGDLRWYSGDRHGGSNLRRLDDAFGELGLHLQTHNGMNWQAFVKQIANGAPAVVIGVASKLPHPIYGNYGLGHAVYVDRYDPKKGFLIYDPGRRASRNGVWITPAQLRAFGWDARADDGTRWNGDVAFAPLSAVKNPTSRSAPLGINVWDPPKRSNGSGAQPPAGHTPTPRNYGVGNDPGVEGRTNDTITRANIGTGSQTNQDGSLRPYNLPLPTTGDEVGAQLDVLDYQQQRALAMSEAFQNGETQFDELDHSKTPLTEATVHQALNDALGASDYGEALAFSMNQPDAAGKIHLNQSGLRSDMLKMGDTREEQFWNQQLLGMHRALVYADTFDSDPEASWATIQREIENAKRFAATLDPGDPLAPEGVTSDFYQRVQDTLASWEDAANPNSTNLEPGAELKDPAARDIATGIRGNVTVRDGLSDGTLVRTIVDGKWTAVPARHYIDPATGSDIALPDTDERTVPVIVDQGNQGVIVHVPLSQVSTGYRKLTIGPMANPSAILAALAPNQRAAFQKLGLQPGDTVPSQFLAGADAEKMRILLAGGAFQAADISVTGIVIPPTEAGGTAQTWVQDPGTGLWYKNKLPIAAPQPDPLGLGTVYMDADINADGTVSATAPHLVFKPNSSFDGVVAPYATKDPKTAQKLFESGALTPFLPPISYRDNNGDVSPDGAQPQMQTMYDKSLMGYMASPAYQNFRAGERAAPPLAQGNAYAPPAGNQTYSPGQPPPAASEPIWGSTQPGFNLMDHLLAPAAKSLDSFLASAAGQNFRAGERAGFVPPPPAQKDYTTEHPTPIKPPTMPKITMAQPFTPPPAKSVHPGSVAGTMYGSNTPKSIDPYAGTNPNEV